MGNFTSQTSYTPHSFNSRLTSVLLIEQNDKAARPTMQTQDTEAGAVALVKQASGAHICAAVVALLLYVM